MIPLASPRVGEDGIDRVTDLLASGMLSTGDVVAEFEDAFSSFVSRTHGVAVASGSVALELALEATFTDGDAIALSPYNCGSVLYSVQRVGLTPVFVDADPATGAIDPDALGELDADVDGVLLSHLFGHPADVDSVRSVAGALDATIVEDFAQAPGATVDGELIGSIGRVSVCSFGATKNLTTAEGGMVVTDETDIASYVSQQRSNTDDVTPPPRSVRMNDIEAAIGLAQLDRYDDILERKRSIAAIYRDELADVSVDLLPVAPWASHVYHAFPVLHGDADTLAAHLREANIETSRLYNKPLHEYDAAPATTESYPVAERFASEVVLLPIHAELTTEEAHTIAAAVAAFFENQ